mgnify:FL=1|tara:strand:- start:28 stop:285 length:258 start_codon:yes stop_codon:yes gene_type:complete
MTRLKQIRNELDKYIKSELEKSPGDRDFDVCFFEDQLNEIIDSFDEIINYDPTPQYLYDDTGGEPAISAQERNRKAFEQKLRDKG